MTAETHRVFNHTAYDSEFIYPFAKMRTSNTVSSFFHKLAGPGPGPWPIFLSFAGPKYRQQKQNDNLRGKNERKKDPNARVIGWSCLILGKCMINTHSAMRSLGREKKKREKKNISLIRFMMYDVLGREIEKKMLIGCLK